MILGIGSDILAVARVAKVQERHPAFAARILAEEEYEVFCQEPNPAAYLAKRFAAKEAVSKALGCGIGAQAGWQEIVTRRRASGCPEVLLRGRALARLNALGANACYLSLSDERDFVLAFALVERRTANEENLR